MRRVGDSKDSGGGQINTGSGGDHIMALNKNGVSFLDQVTHETLIHYPFTEVISTRKVQIEDGTLFLDMKCGNLMQQRITRIQTDQVIVIIKHFSSVHVQKRIVDIFANHTLFVTFLQLMA